MIKLTLLSFREVGVFWEELDGETFHILRSSSPTGDYKVIGVNEAGPFFVDKQVNLYQDGTYYYYRIDGYDKHGDCVSSTEPYLLEISSADNIAMKVIHEAATLLRVMRNPEVYALVKKRDETVCPECWNPITKKVRYPDCSICNGTGKFQGYHNPIPISVSQDVSPLFNVSGMFDGDDVGTGPIEAWTLNYPLLSPQDIIVDSMNQRYVVHQVVRRTKRQHIIRQLLQLSPLPKGHPAYSVFVEREG